MGGHRKLWRGAREDAIISDSLMRGVEHTQGGLTHESIENPRGEAAEVTQWAKALAAKGQTEFSL